MSTAVRYAGYAPGPGMVQNMTAGPPARGGRCAADTV